MTTDQLLLRTEFLLKAREAGHINGRILTYTGFKWLEGELFEIDFELDRRKPEGEFRTVYCGNEVVGFERVK